MDRRVLPNLDGPPDRHAWAVVTALSGAMTLVLFAGGFGLMVVAASEDLVGFAMLGATLGLLCIVTAIATVHAFLYLLSTPRHDPRHGFEVVPKEP